MKYWLVCGLLIWYIILHSQVYFEPVFAGVLGNELYDKVRQSYTPTQVIDYAFARDTMFLKVDAVNRNLSCIYTGLKLYIPEGQDPTQAVFLNGANNGINTEHTYPLSLGTDDTPAKSDMHHLFPSKVKTNADRANQPYGDVIDAVTKRWYKREIELTTIPQANDTIDLYSEEGDNIFEPREQVKGDIARAMFYIYTIYRDQVTTVDPNYFNNQKDNLCKWHFEDQVDKVEWERSHKIAFYQGNNNPFVLDCSLAQRMYCSDYTANCNPDHTNEIDAAEFLSYDVENKAVHLKTPINGYLSMFDLGGNMMWRYDVIDSTNKVALPQDIAEGIYIIQLQVGMRSGVIKVKI